MNRRRDNIKSNIHITYIKLKENSYTKPTRIHKRVRRSTYEKYYSWKVDQLQT